MHPQQMIKLHAALSADTTALHMPLQSTHVGHPSSCLFTCRCSCLVCPLKQLYIHRLLMCQTAADVVCAGVFLEKYVLHARHIEVQIFGDGKGTVVHLGERECSIQRRHQKIVEETPSPYATPDFREAITSAAVSGAAMF